MFENFIYNLAKKKLFYINRSITGPGVRKTLSIYKKIFPQLKIKSVKSGTKMYDWKIPPEWKVTDAYVLDCNKKKIIDFKKNNLHLVGYSIPMNKYVSKKIFLNHISFSSKLKNSIPYVTSYYKKKWGFCISSKLRDKIIKSYKKNDNFKIVIKSKFNINGKLNYGELILPGDSKKEILISTYICHPSMANNELSGSIVSLSLINFFKKIKLQKTLRFIFIPETVGSIFYIYKNFSHLKKYVVAGFNLTCIGDEKPFSFIFTKYKNSQSDKTIMQILKNKNIKYRIYNFLNRGSDERQFNSPGIELPIATICKSKFGTYKEYHTSLDNFKLVTLKGIKQSVFILKKIINIILKKNIPLTTYPCEPFLRKRNLYEDTLDKNNRYLTTKMLLDFLQYSDGKNDIDEISKLIKLRRKECVQIEKILMKNRVLIK